MDIFDFLELIGGLTFFLFGMKMMGSELESQAGDKLSEILRRFTKNKFTAFLSGLVSTAIVQSSSAVTVMVVGFVSSNIMSLKSAIYTIIRQPG